MLSFTSGFCNCIKFFKSWGIYYLVNLATKQEGGSQKRMKTFFRLRCSQQKQKILIANYCITFMKGKREGSNGPIVITHLFFQLEVVKA